MKIAIAQINPIIGDLTGNAQKILEMAQQAIKKGARLLLTPELSLCGYPPRDLLLNPIFVEAMSVTLQQLARDLPVNLAVLVGTVELNCQAHTTGGKPLFNSTALLENGKVKQMFHKRLLPTYDVFDEHRYFEAGQQANYFALDNINIGVTICEDLWNDEEFWGKRSYTANPISDLAILGVDLIVNLSASPYSLGKQSFREAMLRHSAVRFQQPVIYANQVGGNDDLIFDGRSFALNRQGEVMCRAKGFASDLITVDFDESQRDLQLSSVAPIYESEDEEIWQALVLGVRDYAQKCRFSQVVLGLSGGIDSALVATIATEALGKENVFGVLMPSPYSSEHSISDALALADNLGIKTQILPIGDLMQSFDHSLVELFAGTEFGLAEENIQSRIRGNLLMAIANKFGYLLLSTGNKSEMAVGYCTLYGDMNGGLAVIADVPKTRVYSLCKWLNSHQSPVIPENILTKAPSAELKPGQVDQDSLPPYEILDDILQRLIHNHQSVGEIVAAGHDPMVVDKVIQMVARAEFKRRQAPPGLKITDRAFGTGWRMPIASNWNAIKSNYRLSCTF
ncbi:NH(3)-dependent NAD(+) synthetase [Trichormus variabilis ATCC 29413]|uniref:Glutamine-dependent NAD(+) synthetase n=2 Tax=Anabaena variabilis TaxID=264691 RepID=Q3MG43_TRIV2|nr:MULTISPECIES: NAD+ synthase [Nostocaceae]ABA20043.1 NH(3)-dependent NAD(+) synthetase [Trichormus variabilis ATCC 29413]MBC1215983.1 NAD+ synthase [Trichormus variabilis ARAD]MBC1255340.1 NAD+ synthase [Trichormus variabilis V5]MBC1268446.1 NAD+ synthase [Trichormus variabilis FSR]MBC1304392.1 NAD+ synthase [Trichormus variabilis N2B]